MQRSLTPNDVFEMLEGMGEPVRKRDLESIGICYDFGKKTFLIYLYYTRDLKSQEVGIHFKSMASFWHLCQSNVATTHPTAAELRGIVIKINVDN